MSVSRLAIDVVLLPPKFIMEMALEAGEDLRKKYPASPIVLKSRHSYPHISLCMGVISHPDLDRLKQAVKNSARSHRPLDLEVTEFTAHKIPTDELVYEFVIARSRQILDLHESIMKSTDGLLTNDSTKSDFLMPSGTAKITPSWVNNYRLGSSFEKFRPHITVGMGEPNEEWGKYPVSFKAMRLAICRLGTYCTAGEIIWEKELST